MSKILSELTAFLWKSHHSLLVEIIKLLIGCACDIRIFVLIFKSFFDHQYYRTDTTDSSTLEARGKNQPIER